LGSQQLQDGFRFLDRIYSCRHKGYDPAPCSIVDKYSKIGRVKEEKGVERIVVAFCC
jgi:hypothetical protein